MNTESDRQFNLNFNKGLFALLMFVAAYMTTITVKAQSYVATDTRVAYVSPLGKSMSAAPGFVR